MNKHCKILIIIVILALTCAFVLVKVTGLHNPKQIIYTFTHKVPCNESEKRINFDGNYSRDFNDQNETHLAIAQTFGIKPPKNREDAAKKANHLIEIHDCKYYILDDLTHSIPYLTPGAEQLLWEIGKKFNEELATNDIRNCQLLITSVLRTDEDIKKLRRSGNPNASENSAHRYATTFDISYVRFSQFGSEINFYTDPEKFANRKRALAKVLKELRKEGKCYVKFEVRQKCFHITTRIPNSKADMTNR